MKRVTSIALVVVLAAAFGCAKTTPSKDAPKTAPAEKAAMGDKSGADMKVAAKETEALEDVVETEEDFADEVKAAITPTNLESELAKLEAELAASPE